MAEIQAIQNIWIPDASVITSTDGAEKLSAQDAEGAPPVSPGTKPGIEEADGGPGIYADNTHNNQYSAGAGAVKGLWDSFKTFGELLTSNYGTTSGLNPNFRPPEKTTFSTYV